MLGQHDLVSVLGLTDPLSIKNNKKQKLNSCDLRKPFYYIVYV